MSAVELEDRLLDAKELAQYLGINLKTLYTYRHTNFPLPPAFNLGERRMRWRKSEVDAWIESRREQPQAS